MLPVGCPWDAAVFVFISDVSYERVWGMMETTLDVRVAAVSGGQIPASATIRSQSAQYDFRQAFSAITMRNAGP